MKDGVMARNSKKNALPENMTIEEAAEFFDAHSLLEFEGTEEVEVKFKLKLNDYHLIEELTGLSRQDRFNRK